VVGFYLGEVFMEAKECAEVTMVKTKFKNPKARFGF